MNRRKLEQQSYEYKKSIFNLFNTSFSIDAINFYVSSFSFLFFCILICAINRMLYFFGFFRNNFIEKIFQLHSLKQEFLVSRFVDVFLFFLQGMMINELLVSTVFLTLKHVYCPFESIFRMLNAYFIYSKLFIVWLRYLFRFIIFYDNIFFLFSTKMTTFANSIWFE